MKLDLECTCAVLRLDIPAQIFEFIVVNIVLVESPSIQLEPKGCWPAIPLQTFGDASYKRLLDARATCASSVDLDSPGSSPPWSAGGSGHGALELAGALEWSLAMAYTETAW